MTVSVPAIEVADKVGAKCERRPLSIGDGVVGGDIEAELLVATRELLETAFVLVDRLDPVLRLGEAGAECCGVRFEPWVKLDDSWNELVARSPDGGTVLTSAVVSDFPIRRRLHDTVR